MSPLSRPTPPLHKQVVFQNRSHKMGIRRVCTCPPLIPSETTHVRVLLAQPWQAFLVAQNTKVECPSRATSATSIETRSGSFGLLSGRSRSSTNGSTAAGDGSVPPPLPQPPLTAESTAAAAVIQPPFGFVVALAVAPPLSTGTLAVSAPAGAATAEGETAAFLEGDSFAAASERGNEVQHGLPLFRWMGGCRSGGYSWCMLPCRGGGGSGPAWSGRDAGHHCVSNCNLCHEPIRAA